MGGLERTEVGRVGSGFLPLPVWGCELTRRVFSAAGSALLCRPLASPGLPSGVDPTGLQTEDGVTESACAHSEDGLS